LCTNETILTILLLKACLWCIIDFQHYVLTLCLYNAKIHYTSFAEQVRNKLAISPLYGEATGKCV